MAPRSLVLLLVCLGPAWAAGPPDAATLQRFGEIEQTRKRSNQGIALYRAGKVEQAFEIFADVLRRHEKLYPVERYPDGHISLAQALSNLGSLHEARGDLTQAEPLHIRALRMFEQLYPASRYPDGHPELALGLSKLALLYRARGQYSRAEPLLVRALHMSETLHPASRFPHGHPEISRALNGLGAFHESRGAFHRAEPLFARAVKMDEALYPATRFPAGHPNLAASINNLAFVYQSQGNFVEAEPLYQRALRMYEALYPIRDYPDGHPDLASAVGNLAYLYRACGNLGRAEPFFHRALAMREKLYPAARYPAGHPDLAESLNNLARLYHSRGDLVQAEPLFERALRMRETLYPLSAYPVGHPEIASSLNNLAYLFMERGDLARAETLFVRALRMNEALYPRDQYPRGHHLLAVSLLNLGTLYYAQYDLARAKDLFGRALKMRESLYPPARYPRGHPDLVDSLASMAGLHKKLGAYDLAESLYVRSLRMSETLYSADRYPRGHPTLASNVSNYATLLSERGDYAQAEKLYLRGLHLREMLYPAALYPQGHPLLAASLHNLATIYIRQRKFEQAVPLYVRAMAMHRDFVASYASTGHEAAALNILAYQPLTRDAYLSTTLDLPRAEAYAAVWQTKAVLARIHERRHHAVLASASEASRQCWDTIQVLQHEREQLLLAPTGSALARTRDRRIAELDNLIVKNRTDLLGLLPALRRSDELSRTTPADLCKLLPRGVVFVDLLRYLRIEQDPAVAGTKGEKRQARYVAFVVTRETTVRVELGAARPIEQTLERWRRAIVEGSASETDLASAMHRLIWSPLARHLPAKLSVVFVSPDAALNALPWVALRHPETKRILIEYHAVAVVPHGPLLLDRLGETRPAAESRPTLLVVGGVAYDSKPVRSREVARRGEVSETRTWQPLPGTRDELQQIVALAGMRAVTRREGAEASVERLLADLPRAETAHLASHGFFADKKFRSVLQLDERLFDQIEHPGGSIGERIGVGARSPMVLSGLVCAGANLDETPGRGILTAEAIVGLDLRKLHLAVLSACETGLGDVAGGEGVYGLVRAFHLAGTRNVVASLWRVDDEATAALMTLFYRNLWGEPALPPLEALRQAQLAIYREPGRIKEWATSRGVGKPIKLQAATEGKTSPARAWAAFVLSGPGA